MLLSNLIAFLVKYHSMVKIPVLDEWQHEYSVHTKPDTANTANFIDSLTHLR